MSATLHSVDPTLRLKQYLDAGEQLTFPFPYQTNVVETLRLMHGEQLSQDPRCEPALQLLRRRKKAHGAWQVVRTHRPQGWVPFDKPGLWITHQIQKVFS